MRAASQPLSDRQGLQSSDEVVSVSVHHGLIRDFSTNAHPSLVSGWEVAPLHLPDGATHFGVVIDREARVSTVHGTFDLHAGMYFSIPGRAVIVGGKGMAVSHLAYRGQLCVGGPIEEHGRLKYIDGCSDSVLIAPPVLGDPCFNLLYMPPGVDQTMHTHPSIRIGAILDGGGYCDTPVGRIPLKKGSMFILPTDAPHAFHTRDQFLKICVYHPDSDTGPTTDDHPMVNRTLVNGVSANRMPEIRPDIRV